MAELPRMQSGFGAAASDDLYPSAKTAILTALAYLTERICFTAASYAFHRRGEGRVTPEDLGRACRFHMAHPNGVGDEFDDMCKAITFEERIPFELLNRSVFASNAVAAYYRLCDGLVREGHAAPALAAVLIEHIMDENKTAMDEALDACVSSIEESMSEELEEIAQAAEAEADPSIDVDIQALKDEAVGKAIAAEIKRGMDMFLSLRYGEVCSEGQEAAICECTGVDEAADMPWETTSEDDGFKHLVRELFTKIAQQPEEA